LRAYVLTALLFFTLLSFHSQATEWRVQPLSCVTNSAATSCEINLSIWFPDELSGHYCLYLDQEQLKCWSQLPASDQLTLNYGQSANLILKDEFDKVVLKAKLSLKTLSKKRKRVRAPWSIF